MIELPHHVLDAINLSKQKVQYQVYQEDEKDGEKLVRLLQQDLESLETSDIR